jgi:hypothetical protein
MTKRTSVPARGAGTLVLALAAATAWAQAERITYAELKQPLRLDRDAVVKLMSGADIQRVSARGITQRWTNKADGTPVASSINRQGRPFTEHGEWSVNDQGQFCLSIPWHGDTAEAWCRIVLKTDEGYFIANGVQPTDRVRKYEIGR